MMRFHAIVFACVAALITAVPAAAQVVVGELRSAADRQPVAGALVTLVDSMGREQARSLSDGGGRFTMRATRAGRYRLEAQRIGFETAQSPMLSVGTDTLAYVFNVRVSPVQLPSIAAASSDRGCARRADGPAVAVLWNEIRKVLNLTAWTEREGTVDYVVRLYSMTSDAGRRLLFDEDRRTTAGRGQRPFIAAAPAELAQQGFTRPDGEDLILLAPDAAVLMSNEFLDGHCFRLTTNPRTPTLVGLAFEPMHARPDVTDITGVLWVEHTSSALRRLEYSYTNLPATIAAWGAGGSVGFERLDNGQWIVESWSIRTPLLNVSDRGRRPQLSLKGVREEGGVVLRAQESGRALYQPAGDAAVEGIVRNAPDGVPLANARVFLTGTGYEAMTDDDGRYRIEAVRAGRYGVSFMHPASADLSLPMTLDSVTITSGAVTQQPLSLPAFTTILQRLCPGEQENETAHGLLYGVVTDAEGKPAARAELRAQWRGAEMAVSAPAEHWRTAESDGAGRYYLCWVPAQTPITVDMRVGRYVDTVNVHIEPLGLPMRRVDFVR